LISQNIKLWLWKGFNPLWRGSRDGFGAEDFHSRCDGVKNTLTIIKTTTGFIFGGYTSQAWASPQYSEYKRDPNAFLFTFKNPSNMPMKLKVIDSKYAVYHDYSYGPTFGWWHDLHVSDDSNLKKSSYIWSSSYELPGEYTPSCGSPGGYASSCKSPSEYKSRIEHKDYAAGYLTGAFFYGDFDSKTFPKFRVAEIETFEVIFS